MSPPKIKGLKPYGPDISAVHSEVVNLLYEEYEALRLCDYDAYNHHQASVLMCVSRPTFTRIYASALRKIAKALVEGKQISIEGGKVYFDSDWYHCLHCGCDFNNPEKENKITRCPLCNAEQISAYEVNSFEQNKVLNQCGDICICPDCGYKHQHELGIPCQQTFCPRCNSLLRRQPKEKCNM